MSLNIILLEGNLATVPEVRSAPSGKTIGKFLMAVTRQPGKPEMGKDFVRVIVWDKAALNVEKFLAKGSRVLVRGRLRSEFYQKDESTSARLNTEVYADQVTFLSAPPAAAVAAPAGRGGR